MNMRNLAIWGVIAALLIALMVAMQSNAGSANVQELAISEVRQLAKDRQLAEITITDTTITGTKVDGEAFTAEKLTFEPDLVAWFSDQGVKVTADSKTGFTLIGLLFNFANQMTDIPLLNLCVLIIQISF